VRRRVLCASMVLVGLIAGTTVASAQQDGRAYKVGYLTFSGVNPNIVRLRDAMRERGYVEGKNVVIDWRHGNGDLASLATQAAALVAAGVDVIATDGAPATAAAMQASATVPIVFANVADPIASRLIASLSHPGGNVTGLANLAQETAGKRLEMLKTIVPDATRIAIMFNPDNPGNVAQAQAARQAAGALRIELISAEVRRVDDYEGAFAAIARGRAEGLFVPDDPFFVGASETLLMFAVSHKLPTIYQNRYLVSAGGLMSYGIDLSDSYRQVVAYIDKIRKGAKPADLPVQQPTKFELVINMKAAKAFGLTIPPSILARADEVIE
jgi:putative ABC transport system substrate-binding protein